MTGEAIERCLDCFKEDGGAAGRFRTELDQARAELRALRDAALLFREFPVELDEKLVRVLDLPRLSIDGWRIIHGRKELSGPIVNGLPVLTPEARIALGGKP